MHHRRKTRHNLSRRNRSLAGATIESAVRRAVPVFAAEQLERRILFDNTINVINLNDSGNGSLRQAIISANSLGGINTIDFANGVTGTITLSSELPYLAATTTIHGPGAGSLTINANNHGVVFGIQHITAEIDNLTIVGGSTENRMAPFDPGGGIYNSGNLTLSNCIISGNSGYIGGGICNSGTVIITGCTIRNNAVNFATSFGQMDFGGGGIFNFGNGTATIINSTISGNSISNLDSNVYSGGGGILNEGQLTLTNSSLFGNTATGYSGGGILNFGTITASGSSITFNSAKIGAGVANEGTGTITNCRVNNNTSTTIGGGIFNNANPITGLSVINSTLNNNSASNGGAIYNGDTGELSVTGSTLDANGASFGGGGIFNAFQMTLNTCTLDGNHSGETGGGVENFIGTATITNSNITNNTADVNPSHGDPGGGGIENFDLLYLTGSIVSGNSVGPRDNGGGLLNGGTAVINSSTFSGNSALSGAGALSEGTISFINSTISGNTATSFNNYIGAGGGLYASFGQASVVNTTISGNTAQLGGGIAVLGFGSVHQATLTLTNSTITGNNAIGSGGGIGSLYASINVTDCTISGNFAPAGGGGGASFQFATVVLDGVIVAVNTGGDLANSIGANLSGLHDLIGDGSDGGILSKSLSGTPANPLNPQLTALGNYGGPTQTMALMPGSPAINAGRSFVVLDSNNNNIVDSDQRGVPRPSPTGYDIGAYQTGPLIVNTLGDPASFTPGILSLREAIYIADTDTAGSAQTIFFSNNLAGTINLASQLPVLGNNLSIDGPGASVITVNAAGHGNVFSIVSGNVLIENLTITGGNSSFGGGIFNSGGNLTVANSTITGNTGSTEGGGIYNGTGSLTVTDCTITSNTATGAGGAIDNQGGIVNIAFSTISSNKVFSGSGGFFNGGGGAIYSYGGFNGLGTLTITNSTIAANQCGGLGGAISNNLSTLTVVNTTITGNIGANGDAVYANGSLTFVDDTISNNIGSGFGVFVVGQGGNWPTNCVLNGTIVAGNPGPNSLSVGFNATLSGSNDLLADSSDSNVLTSTIRNVPNPLLASLGNFGGPTQTLAILPGSPAIGGGANFFIPGINTLTDQRGIARPQGPESDIGAYEIQRSAFVVNTVSDAAFQPVGAVSLRDAIASAISIGGSNNITFQNGLNGTINLINSLASFVSNISITGPGANIVTVNGAGQGSGAIFFVNAGITSTIQNLTITGGIYNGSIASFGNLTVAQSTITGGFGANAGALYCRNGSMTVINCTLTGNSSFFEGGAILNNGYTSVTNTTVSGNRSEYGGGICNTGTMVITGSTISGNTAGANGVGSGGGIYSDKTLSVTNCTITGNTSNYGGGAVENFKGSLTITDSTISGNSAAGTGGGIDDTAGSNIVNGTILAADSGGEISIKSAGTLSGSNDLIADGSDAGVLLTSLRGTIANPLNPLLLALASNGGPTQTMALLGNSPAIAHGAVFAAANAVDQRGNPRPAGSVDIGAFQTTIFTVNTLADPATISPGVLSLRQAITQADAAGGHPIISFAAGLTGTIAPTSLLPAVSTAMQINGPGVAVIAINLAGAGNHLTINAPVVTQINDLTITGGSIANNGSLNALGHLAAGPITGAGSLSVGSLGQTSKLTFLNNTGASTQSSLTVSTGSTLDITNNKLLINFGSPANDPISTIKSLLTTGYKNGAWTGAGIDSSTAANPSGPALAVGYADGNTDGFPAQPNQIVVKYTLAGDASLDGFVNFQDLVAVIQNFNKGGTDWSRGNFGYGNSTSFQSLVAVVQNFNKTLTPPASSASQIGSTTIPLARSAAAQTPPVIISPQQNQSPESAARPAAITASADELLYDNDSVDSIFEPSLPALYNDLPTNSNVNEFA